MSWSPRRVRARPAERLRRTVTPLAAGLLFAALRDAADGLVIGFGSVLAPVAGLPAAIPAAAQLPDPGHLSAVALAAALGGLVGGTIARCRRQPQEEVSRITLTGSFVGGWIGLVAWLAACVTP